MGVWKDGRWEVQTALFFSVFCGKNSFSMKETKKKYWTVTQIISLFYIYQQIFITVGPTIKKNNS